MINRNDLTEAYPHHFIGEASSLGLPPGEWPTVLLTNLGNGQVLIQERHKVMYGELVSVTYCQAGGCVTVEILND